MSENKKPRIAEILGVEVGERFSIGGYPTDYGLVQVCEDGKIRRVISITEFPFAADGEVGHKIGANALYYLLNHPDRIIRKPRWTEQEKEEAKQIRRLLPWAENIRRTDTGNLLINSCVYEIYPGLFIYDGFFPSLKPGESVTLDEIIGGAE